MHPSGWRGRVLGVCGVDTPQAERLRSSQRQQGRGVRARYIQIRRQRRRVAVSHFFSSSTISYSASTALARLVSSALWQLALQYAENTAKVSNLIFIAPFCSLVLIHFALGEQILWSTVVGLLFIVAGLLYQQFGARTHSTDP